MAKISELIKILRGEGNIAGARRAERIGDEAPYAAERISADELRRTLSGMGDNAESLAIITPEEFRYLAEQLPEEYVNRPATQQHIADLQNIAQEKGFRDIPFLSYNEYPGVNQLGVFGHEGRHRMRALENLGDEKALVRLIPRGDVREPLPRRSRSEFLQALAEKYGDPLMLDPESYNQQLIPMKSRLRSALLEKPTAAERAGANFDMEEFRNKYGYTGRKPVQPFAGGGLAKFFSAVDEAVANLRQKKGTGEQMLKEIQKAPGVKKEELELRRLPEKLAGQQKVTREDIQAMLQAVPAPKLSMTVKSKKPKKAAPPDLEKWIGESRDRKLAVEAAERHGYEPVQNPEDPAMIGFLSPDGDIVDSDDIMYIFETDVEMAAEALQDAKQKYFDLINNPTSTKEAIDAADNEYADARRQYNDLADQRDYIKDFFEQWQLDLGKVDPPKFEKFTTKGPKENYRELLIQLDRPERKEIPMPPFEYNRQGLGGDPQEVTVDEAMQRLGLQSPAEVGYKAESVLFYPRGNYIVKRRDGRYYAEVAGDEIIKEDLGDVETWLATQLQADLQRPIFESQGKPYVQPAHFPEEDIVVHARVDDRVGPNGEKILYVEEIQSDWHQDARKARLNEAKNRVNKGSIQAEISDAAMAQMREELGLPGDAVIPSAEDSPEVRQRFLEVFEELEDARINEEAKKLPKDFGYKKMGTRTPPWQQTSHELAIKQIFDTAAREGYDKVMFSPGSEQVKRYSLGEYLDEIKVHSRATSSGTVYDLEGLTKDGRTIDRTFANKKELAEHIGDDKAKMALERIAENKAKGSRPRAVLTGEDLLLGGKKAQGKLKIYDDIIPNYVQKYAGKEFNVQPGKTSIDADNIAMSDRRREFAENFLDRRRRELRRSFDEGVIPAGAEDIEGEILEEARKVVLKGFQPGYSTLKERFAEKFAPKFTDDLSELGGSLKTDYEGLINELDPSSFRDRAIDRFPFTSAGEALEWLDPGKVKFRDPEKQGLYEDWLEEQIMETATRPFVMDKVLIPRFRKMAEEELAARGEDFYKDMELPPRLEGMSVDITPEMREKITSRGQPLFVVPPAAAAAAALTEEEEPVQEFKEAGRVEKKEGLAKEQFASPFDETRRIGPRPGLGSGPARIRDLTKILRGEESEAKNVERQRIAGNVKAGEEFGEYMYDMIVPQAPWEVALEAAFFPVPRPVRKVALAMAGGMYDPEAEAGRLRLLHGSPGKIDKLEQGRDLWATTDPEYALKRGFDKMKMARGAQGPAMVNQFGIEDTELMRLADKYSPEDIEIARRAFSKLPQGREVTGEEIYELASTNTGGAKAAALENVTRALGKKGYQVPPGADDKGEWYRVLEQTDLEPYGKGGIVGAIKGAMKMTDTPPDPSRRKAIGLREKIEEPGALTTVETEVSASDLDTLQKALGNVGQAILNEPVSRREVLKRGALSTASNLIPGGGVLQQVAKEVVPMVAKADLPQIGDAEALASIAKYAMGTFDDYSLAENVYGKLTGKSAKQAFNLKTEDVGPEAWELWDRMSFEQDYDDVAKMAGLDIDTIAQKTNLPPETVRKLVGNDASVIASLINSSGASRGLQDIRENVPSWEVREMTGYDNLWADQKEVDDAIRKAIKVSDDEQEIVGFVLDEMRSKFFDRHRGKAKNAFDEKITQTFIDDELLDSLWDEALQNDDAAYDIIVERIDELK